MKTILIILLGSLSTYLYVDKFLFKGKLAQLFFDGWRSLLREWFGPILRFSCRSSPEQPLASPEQEVISTLTDDNLVEKKRYVSRQKEPTGDIGPKREPKTAGDDTFAATTKVEQEPRIMEWRAPAFQRTQTPRPAEKKQPQRWEDKGFAAARFVPVNGGDGEEEIIEIIDEEQIRREVAEQLELAQADEQRDLLEPTNEEKYGIDNFDAGAYS